MYSDNEASDKESEYEQPSPDDSPTAITHKSLSTVCFRSTESPGRPAALRATQSFTGAFEELRLNNVQHLHLNQKTDIGTCLKRAVTCPCGCFLSPAATGPFRTREKTTLALHVVSPDVLQHHGYAYEPKQIAMFWKKDCRTFLWKGKSKAAKDDPNRRNADTALTTK